MLTDGVVIFDYRFCKGCGVCANECRVKAITMVREEV
jgi:Pyruvate/2-oxoacid:ferredoxin oxidoreductase delta subunit